MSNTQNDRNSNKLAALRQRLAAGKGPQFWRSLNELSESEAFLEHLHQEFPRETSWISTLSRRDFLKLLAAPLALAGLSACVPQPIERIVPYVEAPENLVPGNPLFFATAMELDGYARGLLVESHEGRPTKVEGNPDHPASLGATDAFGQGSILTLYDPDRAQVVSSRGQIRTWDVFQQEIRSAMEGQSGGDGAGLRILTGTVTSPTLAAQIGELLEAYPQARWHQYDPIGRDQVRAGAEMAFGEVVQTQYNLAEADIIVSLDSNFLFREPGNLRYIRQFAERRPGTASEDNLNRLYVIESSLTITGGGADHRLAVKASQIIGIAQAMAARLGIGAAPDTIPAPSGWIEAMVDDLNAHQGSSVVIAGEQQPAAVHALAHAMNTALGNVGKTVFYTDPVEFQPTNQIASLIELVQALNAGQVDLLIILNENPVFSAPYDLNFAEALSKARLSVYSGLYEDETAQVAHWFIPKTHFLEMWSDVRAFDGTVSVIQPLIEPLYNGRSPHELLALLLGQSMTDGYEIVRSYWQQQFSGQAPNQETPPAEEPSPSGTPGAEELESTPTAVPTAEAAQTTPAAETPAPAGQEEEAAIASFRFERWWRQVLHAGMIPDTALAPRQVSLSASVDSVEAEPAAGNALEIVFEPDPSIWDGRFANNAWLQELPRPLSKLTWDNAAYLSPATAEQLGLEDEQVVELRFRGQSVEAPVYILAGQPEGSITVHLGYGRQRGGEVLGNTGFNAYAIRPSDALWFGSGLEINPTGRKYPLATTQDHFSMEGRHLVRSATVEEYRQNPEFVQEYEHGPETSEEHGLVPEPPSLYPEVNYDGYAWGMAINLSACVGCNACVIACQAENNIPVVGKEQVLVGREMHWLRVDRYFEGEDLEQPGTHFQPVLCMHCEKAPCEPVCPVNATVHGSEGLNEMVYSRCVGTRYCSNNCPYKVRRFNFLQYAEEDLLPLKMGRNPDVSVRSRGVMEKCTYCVQRISAARIDAKVAGKPIEAGEVVTACQQACPSRAISFGNINNPEEQVAKMKALPLNYGLLTELGTQPRTTYLARLRNPNPAMPAA